MDRDLFVRSKANPIIKPADLPLNVNGVLNPGFALVDEEVVLLLRIENRRGISGIYVARSANGIDGWRIEPQPLLEPRLAEYPYEKWGCEDARVTQIGPHTWMIAYTAYSPFGPGVALAKTEDFVSVERLGLVMSPNNKDATIFPEKTNGSWLMLHRPVTGSGEHVWYASSDDLLHWALPGVLLPANGGPWWDGLKVGTGAPPIRTERGWLLIYHGVKEAGGGHLIYRLGLALLDLKDPRKLLARSSDWVFAPETEYEQRGLVPDVVYTCGALERDGEIWMYYGGADTVVGLAIARTSDLLDFVLEHDFLPEERSRSMNRFTDSSR